MSLLKHLSNRFFALVLKGRTTTQLANRLSKLGQAKLAYDEELGQFQVSKNGAVYEDIGLSSSGPFPGYLMEWVSATQIKLTAGGVDGKYRVPVSSGSDRVIVQGSADLTATMDTSLAQVDNVTVDTSTDGTWTIDIDGVDCTFVSSSHTIEQIRDGLIAAIAASAAPATALPISTDELAISLDESGAFTTTLEGDRAGDMTLTARPETGIGYDLWLETKPFGAIPKLIFAPSGTVPTLSKDYTHKAWVWFACNLDGGGSDLMPFIHSGNECHYYHDSVGHAAYRGETAILSGTATSDTDIDLTNLAPDPAQTPRTPIVKAYLRAASSAASGLSVDLLLNDGSTQRAEIKMAEIGAVTGRTRDRTIPWEFPLLNTLASTISYAWSGAPTGGFTLGVLGWKV